ncbi:MAG: single-stranded-DNA-specific exonuclease RecJ [Sulfurovaceae bacterium]
MSLEIYKEIEQKLKKRFESSGGFLTLSDLPAPHSLKDLTQSALRIKEAISNREKIIIVGDYDVDGVVATSLLLDFFDAIDYEVDWFIPNRFEHGYGLSTKILSSLQEHDVIITVDNGINANDVALWCKQNNKTLIITDHHTPKEALPEAFSIVDPKRDDCDFVYPDICGATVAWYLIAGIKKELSLEIELRSYLLLVAIATIADMMPLLHINRAIVTAGLKEFEKNERAFAHTLKEHFQKENFTSEDISFLIAPLLNSAGRMDDASLGVNFLRSPNIHEARACLQKLVQKNEMRKEEEKRIFQESLHHILNPDDAILVAYKDDWHEGVIGIVAARLAKHFDKPAIVLCKGGDTLLKGSGRSSLACNLFESVRYCERVLEKFGGHTFAIGVSLMEKNLPFFIEKLKEGYVKSAGDNLGDKYIYNLKFEHIDFTLTDIFKKYEPFGEANPYPRFFAESIEVLSASSMGKNAEHMRYILRQDQHTFEAIEFRAKEPIESGEKIDFIYKIDVNIFRGVTKLQLIIDNITFIYK